LGDSDGAAWRVFISHTSELREFPRGTSYVAAVERAISAAGHVIVKGEVALCSRSLLRRIGVFT
jgi:hypothetical protein